MKKIIITIASFFSLNASAGILVEPNLGFHFGSHTFTDVGNVSRDGTSSGFGLGLRAAYKYDMFFGGIDLQYSSPTMTADTATVNGIDFINSTLGDDWSGSNFQFGISAGAEMPMGIRGWLGYYFINSMSTDDVVNTKYTGGAFRIGVGYKIIPLVSANFEYIGSSWTADTQDNVQSPTSELTQSAFFISASVPYEIDVNF